MLKAAQALCKPYSDLRNATAFVGWKPEHSFALKVLLESWVKDPGAVLQA